MNVLNAILDALVGGLLAPFAAAPLLGLIVLGLLSGVLAAAAFRYISNQKALKRVADRSRANLLAVWLFRDDPVVSIRAQAGLLAASGLRLLHSLVPMLVLLPVFVLLLAHMAMRYEFKPLTPGQTTLVEAQLSPQGWELRDAIAFEPPAGTTIEARVRDESLQRIVWRIRTGAAGGTLRWSVPDAPTVEKSLAVSAATDLMLTNPLRPGTAFLDRLLYPAEPAFGADDAIRSIRVEHASRVHSVFGWDIPWWLTLFVVSILGALTVKPWLKVQF
jgi:hypothetical protein